jgi:hypothetical protein
MIGKRKSTPRARRGPVTFETVRELAGALPGAEEGTSYGTPAFKVRKKMFVRLHQEGDAIVVMIDFAERAARMKLDPETCFITDHYLNYPAMLVRLATVDRDTLGELLEESWRRAAPGNLVAALSDGKPPTLHPARSPRKPRRRKSNESKPPPAR